MRKIEKIIMHCSDSPHGRGDDAAVIHDWHLDRGWNGIGYHYVILEDGEIQNGRPECWIGSHVKGQNSKSIGICLIGKGEYTEEQVTSLLGLLTSLTSKYPETEIYEHHYFNRAKGCPLFDVDMKKKISQTFGEKYIQ